MGRACARRALRDRCVPFRETDGAVTPRDARDPRHRRRSAPAALARRAARLPLRRARAARRAAVIVCDADGRSLDFGGRPRPARPTCIRSSGPRPSASCTRTARRSARTRRRCCARCAARTCATSSCASTARSAARAAGLRRPGDGPDGRLLGAVIAAADLTALRETEELLRVSEERHRRVVESMDDCVFETDAQGRWTYLNEAWTAATGYGVEATLGQPCEGVRPSRPTARATRARSRRCCAASRPTARLAHRFLDRRAAPSAGSTCRCARSAAGTGCRPASWASCATSPTSSARASTRPPRAPSCGCCPARTASRSWGRGCWRRSCVDLGWDVAELWRMGGDECLHRTAGWTAAGVAVRSLHGRRRCSRSRSATASRARRGCRASRCGAPTSADPRAPRTRLHDGLARPSRCRCAPRASRSASCCSSRGPRASPSPGSCGCSRRSAPTSASSCSAATPSAAPPSRPPTSRRSPASRTRSPPRTTCTRARTTLARAVRDVTGASSVVLWEPVARREELEVTASTAPPCAG